MKSIQVVVHCWNPPSVTEYAQTLKWQIASLINHRSANAFVCINVCCNQEDSLVKKVMLDATDELGYREKTASQGMDPNFDITFTELSKTELFSRAIGRNKVAKLTTYTTFDVVWFCDCDYVFGEGCLESVVEQVVEDDVIYYPKIHFITESHELGAQLLRDNADNLLPEIDPAHYVPKRVTKAIGGLQIVTGNTARKYGYLDRTKWMKPVSEEGGFRNTRCDIAYRNSIPLSSSIEVPNLYRLRHLVEGLFLNAEGKPR